MSNTTEHVTTAEQLAAIPDDGRRYELVEGVLTMMSPAGGRHGRIAGKVYRRIANYVEQNDLGETYAAETGFLLSRGPDTVRAPDAAFIAKGRLGELADHPGFLPLAPDVAVEVVSPRDRASEVAAKARAWMDAGVQVVLVVDPQASRVELHRPNNATEVRTDGLVNLNDVLPGFQLDIAELFA
jgi:Uma2 family endonuclease